MFSYLHILNEQDFKDFQDCQLSQDLTASLTSPLLQYNLT